MEENSKKSRIKNAISRLGEVIGYFHRNVISPSGDWMFEFDASKGMPWMNPGYIVAENVNYSLSLPGNATQMDRLSEEMISKLYEGTKGLETIAGNIVARRLAILNGKPVISFFSNCDVAGKNTGIVYVLEGIQFPVCTQEE